VRRLWSQPRARTWLIHPGDVDLGDPEIVEDLTSRLDRPAFKQVAEADIASRDPRRPAHAEEVDQGYGEERPAQRLATTVFLHSLTQTGTTGIDQPSLLAATLRPGDQPATLERVLEALRERCWFLEVDERGPRYRFTTEPQLAKVIEEERARLSFVQAKEFLCQQIEAIFHRSVLVPVFFPSEPADLPDDAEAPKLAILHFDAAKTSADDDTIPSLVRTLFAQAGQAGLRLYRNAVVFLVADRHEVDAMVERARTFLAIDRLLNSPTVEGSFDERKRNELRRRYDEGRLQVRVAIMRAYRFLYYPHGDASADGVPLHRDILPVQDQGKVERNQTQVVEHRLQTLEKLRRVDDGKGLPAPAFVRARAFGIQERLSTAELRRAFFRHTGLPLLTDAVNGVREIVRLGIRAGEWVYYDAGAQQAYDRASELDPTVRIAEDAFVYTPEAAAREHLPLVRPRPPQPVPTVERCPVCGEPTASCRCGNGITPPRMTEEAIESVGPLSQAIARL
ncbi:MAG: hypothetical protein NZL87_07715, partial [Thermomicrobium sp.]|nr:hypothetical protein [Thermomicrobium sp.]